MNNTTKTTIYTVYGRANPGDAEPITATSTDPALS